MDVLLQLLRAMPEFCQLKESIDARRTAAVSGVSQIVRSHFIAALCAETGRPALVVCQDELAASRMQDELAAFLGARPPVLPGRETLDKMTYRERLALKHSDPEGYKRMRGV